MSSGTPARRGSSVKSKLAALDGASLHLGGILGERLSANRRRLADVDEAALLAPFQRNNVDLNFDCAWAGEHVGKFLDAACNSLRFLDDASLRAKADRCAAALVAAQDEDGYLGAYSPERRWSSWDVWVHKYSLIGLISYHRLTGCEASLRAATAAADLLLTMFGDEPDQKNISAVGMHMGLASTSVLQPICALYTLTAGPCYLDFCRYIVRSYEFTGASRLVGALLEHGEVHRTANGKAYEMLSNLVGLVDLYQLTGEAALLQAVTNAWDDIVENQLYETGTVSAGEHFQSPGRLAYHHASNVGETCATTSWLELNHQLLLLTGQAKYGAEIERSVFNHLLSAQDPRDGGFCYYTGLVGQKEFSTALLCCVSSGPRAIASLPALSWARDDDAIVLNLLSAGSVTFDQRGERVTITIDTSYPASGAASIKIEARAPVRFALRIRAPAACEAFSARWNGHLRAANAGEWLELEDLWGSGSIVQLSMRLPLRATTPSGVHDCVLLQRGPQVLAFDCGCNFDVETRHRIAIDPARLRSGEEITHSIPPGLGATEVDIDGLAGIEGHDGRYSYTPARLRLIPFSEARAYSALLATREARAPLALSAFERSAASHERPGDLREAITDEDTASYRVIYGSDRSVAALVGFEDKDLGRVWFAARIGAPHLISRIILRQGPINSAGGWFDARAGKPIIEIVTKPLGSFYEFLPDFYRAEWTALAPLASYPLTSPDDAATLKEGQEFELMLTAPIRAYAVRVIGAPARETVTCAGLAAYGPAFRQS
jgi:DUF1680 family protein